MHALLQLAGAGQLTLAAVSLALPRILGWREQTRALDPLTRRVFWTYAGYILGTNVALGLVCLLAPAALASASVLALSVCGYALCYWGVRLLLQVVSFRHHAPRGRFYALADAAVTLLFAYLSGLFGWLLWTGLAGS